MSERRSRTTAVVAACAAGERFGAVALLPSRARRRRPSWCSAAEPDADRCPVRVHRPRRCRRQGRAARPGRGLPRVRASSTTGDAWSRRTRSLFTIERETYQAAVDQKIAQRDAAKAALDQRRVCSSSAPPSFCAPTPARRQTYDQRLSEQLQAKAQLEDAERPAARRRDPAVLHRDQVADRRPHRPRRRSRPATSSAPTPACWPRW